MCRITGPTGRNDEAGGKYRTVIIAIDSCRFSYDISGRAAEHDHRV
jgi:hypothetical protein